MWSSDLYLCCWFVSCTEQDSSITVAFDDIPEDGLNSPLRLEKVANEVLHLNDFTLAVISLPFYINNLWTFPVQVTYRRMKDALIQLSKGVQKGPASDLIPVLFGERPPAVSKKDVTFSPFNSNLDHSQVIILALPSANHL